MNVIASTFFFSLIAFNSAAKSYLLEEKPKLLCFFQHLLEGDATTSRQSTSTVELETEASANFVGR
jgi:hypothetical protein